MVMHWMNAQNALHWMQAFDECIGSTAQDALLWMNALDVNALHWMQALDKCTVNAVDECIAHCIGALEAAGTLRWHLLCLATNHASCMCS